MCDYQAGRNGTKWSSSQCDHGAIQLNDDGPSLGGIPYQHAPVRATSDRLPAGQHRDRYHMSGVVP
jgi:hypothetical protein